MAARDEAAGDRGEERVLVRRAPDRERQPSARPQHATGLGQCGGGVGHQHVPEAAEHAVDRVGVELDRLGVDQAVRDVGDAALGAAAAGHLEHRRGEVAGDQLAALADDRGDLEPGVARPRGKLEHRVTRPRLQLLDQPLLNGHCRCLDERSLALPAGSDRLGDLEAGAPHLAALRLLVILHLGLLRARRW
ncbi:MAG: hypothetical protein R2736_19840 [Solirubrobacterales bacterium]